MPTPSMSPPAGRVVRSADSHVRVTPLGSLYVSLPHVVSYSSFQNKVADALDQLHPPPFLLGLSERVSGLDFASKMNRGHIPMARLISLWRRKQTCRRQLHAMQVFTVTACTSSWIFNLIFVHP